MKTRISYYTTILLVMGIFSTAFGQFAVRSQFEDQQSGYWILGLNGGFSYQSSDVDATADGWGFGATLGKNVYYKKGAPLSFDLRGRLLLAQQYGLDATRSYDITNNEAVNGSDDADYINYPTGLGVDKGFVYHNHKTTVGEAALEGVFTLNQLQERTGIVASIYGGIGLDAHATQTDQLNSQGEEYYTEYANLSEDQKAAAIRKELKSAILDNNYESFADGYNNGVKLTFMPSLGVELGYQLTPRFSVHAGHRFTFTRDNIIDGEQWKDDQNDLYHYTNFALRWKVTPYHLRPKAPEITIYNPTGTPHSYGEDRFTVRARVLHVNSSADIYCELNGSAVPFDFANDILRFNGRLNLGENYVNITATNEVGVDRKQLILIYKDIVPPPSVFPPVVNITNPPRKGHQVQDEYFTVKARIQHVERNGNIKLLINGYENRDFNFSTGSGILSANIRLQTGTNEIRVIATNNDGRDEDISSVILKPRAEPKPIVRINRPSRPDQTVEDQYYTVEATIEHVPYKKDVRFVLNGYEVRDFNFNPRNGSFNSNIRLEEGNNRIRIIGTNEYGSDEAVSSMIYRLKARPKPIIRLQNPPRSDYRVEESYFNVKATIENVAYKKDVRFVLNGYDVRDYNFNPRNGTFNSNIDLQEGTNRIRIIATNENGSDEVASSIIYSPRSEPKPTVRITDPDRERVETQNTTARITATIRNIEYKDEINVLVNNRRTNNFTFSPSRERVELSIDLNPGSNTVEIIAQNRNGKASDRVEIIRKVRMPNPPTVNISSPNNNDESPNDNVRILANTRHIDRKDQVEFVVNGSRVYNFNFSNGRIEGTVRLRNGSNTIKVKVTNNDGIAEDQITVYYRPTPSPTVNIEQPMNGKHFTNSSIDFSASTQYVSSKSNIRLTLNGSTINSFYFSTSSKDVRTQLNLREGRNVIRINVSNDAGNASDEVTVHYDKQKAPIVNITKPSTNNVRVQNVNYAFEGSVQNIGTKSEVSVKLNGRNINFNLNGGIVKATLNLRQGNNTVILAANNAAGSDQEQRTIIYSVPKPPTVNITKPANNSTVSKNSTGLQARVQNVGKKNELKVYLNNKPVSFTFYNGNITANITNLKVGTNQIKVTAQNSDGQAQDQVKVIYKAAPAAAKPIVNFVQPKEAQVTIKSQSFTYRAEVKNVTSKKDIKVYVNKKIITDFQFDSKSKIVSGNLTLGAGTNIIRVEAFNKAGKDDDTVNVRVNAKPQGLKPVIVVESISQPTGNPLNPSSLRSTIIANIQGVTSKDQVSFTFNGKATTFSFNTRTKLFQSTVQIERGDNTFAITATNSNGSSTVTRTENFE